MTTHEQTQQIARSLNDKAYSETFVEAEITTTVPFQIRAMRKERHWTQKDLASKTGQHQKTISDFENPDIGPQSITSLRKIAAAFDVGLVVRFAPFSELVEWSANISRRSHFVPSRTADTKLRAQQRGKPMTDDTRLRELVKLWRWRATDWPSSDFKVAAEELEALLDAAPGGWQGLDRCESCPHHRVNHPGGPCVLCPCKQFAAAPREEPTA